MQNINRKVSETKVFGKFFTLTCKKSRNILKTKDNPYGLVRVFRIKVSPNKLRGIERICLDADLFLLRKDYGVTGRPTGSSKQIPQHRFLMISKIHFV